MRLVGRWDFSKVRFFACGAHGRYQNLREHLFVLVFLVNVCPSMSHEFKWIDYPFWVIISIAPPEARHISPVFCSHCRRTSVLIDLHYACSPWDFDMNSQIMADPVLRILTLANEIIIPRLAPEYNGDRKYFPKCGSGRVTQPPSFGKACTIQYLEGSFQKSLTVIHG
jgi:hypothetical protein